MDATVNPRLLYLDPLPHGCPKTPQMQYSGYNQLIRWVEQTRRFRVAVYEWCNGSNRFSTEKEGNRRRIFPLLPRGIPFITSRHYTNPLSEIFAFGERPDIIHNINAENTFLLQGLFKKQYRARIVATLHQPIEIFLRIMPPHWRRFYRHLDAIITTSSREARFFQAELPDVDVRFIPHGNNNHIFSKSVLDPNLGLCIGGWLRDFKTLARAMKIIKQSYPEYKIIIVNRKKPPDYAAYQGENIIFKINIPDEELLSYFQKAAMLILPLKHCTSNNAILEALASGVPVITNKIGGVPDYVDESCALFFEQGDFQGLADQVKYLKQDPGVLRRMSKAALDRSEKFDWERISSRLINEVYCL